jgi:hypothetical protein
MRALNSVQYNGVQGCGFMAARARTHDATAALTTRMNALDAPNSQAPHAPARAHDALTRELRGQLAMPGPGPPPANPAHAHTHEPDSLNTHAHDAHLRAIPAMDLDLVYRHRSAPCQTWLIANIHPLSHDLEQAWVIVDVAEQRLLLVLLLLHLE